MESPADKAAARRLGERRDAPRTRRSSISFEHSHRSNSRALKVPTVAAYTKELKKFKKAYPGVKEISPWNEVNRCHALRDGSVQGQPTKTAVHTGPSSPRSTTWPRARCSRARSTGSSASTSSTSRTSTRRSSTCKSFLRYASPDPKIIGFHNYSDTNRFSTTRTKRVLQTFRGKVWLTETGGIVKLGASFPFSTSRAAQGPRLHVHAGKTNSRISRAVRLPVQPPAGRVDGVLRRGPHQSGRHAAPGLRRRQDAARRAAAISRTLGAVPTFCRHNRLEATCPICARKRKEGEVARAAPGDASPGAVVRPGAPRPPAAAA